MNSYFQRITTKIISVNQKDYDRLLQWGIPKDKVKIIYNGIDIKNYLECESSENGSQREPVVVQLGRLSYQKDPIKFIEGANLVCQDFPNVKFLIIGNGPLRTEVEKKIIDFNLKDKIDVICYQENVNEIINSVNIVTLTSEWEGTPYSVLEAMACAKPVVVTDVNGCSEIVENGKTGFLTPYNHVVEWSQKVLYLLKNPNLARQLGEAGRQKVVAEFSLDLMMAKIVDTYLEVLE